MEFTVLTADSTSQEFFSIELDQYFREQLEAMKAQDAALSTRINSYSESPRATLDSIDQALIVKFGKKLQADLLDASKPDNKQYLQLLVKEIVLKDGVATIRGGRMALAGAIRYCAERKNPITAKAVIGFNEVWRPLPDLNRCRRRERAVSWAGLDEGDV